jgi:hypothetical protein
VITEPIKVEGLALLARQLRKLDKDAPKALRLVHNEAAQLVVATAIPNVPSKTGRARATLKARSTRTESRAQGGSTRAPYYPWLDFGGRVGIRKSVRRPFTSDGRYLYPAYVKRRADVLELLETALLELCREHGLDVTG